MPQVQGWLQRIPVMPVTILALDLLLQEPAIDLSALSRLVLTDVGATLHLFHLFGQENELAGAWPGRINECLAIVDIDTWFSRLSAHATVPQRQHPQAITALWKHSHLIAQYTEGIACVLDGISAESACLIGLMHEVRAIAALLGFPNPPSAGALLHSLGGVPGFICQALMDLDQGPSAFWKAILKVAHGLAADRRTLNGTLGLVEAGHIRDLVLSEISTSQAC